LNFCFFSDGDLTTTRVEERIDGAVTETSLDLEPETGLNEIPEEQYESTKLGEDKKSELAKILEEKLKVLYEDNDSVPISSEM